MWKNYLKIALRSLRKHKGTSFINVGGLAIGMACCILIYFFVRDELTYDDFHTHIDTMYRVEGNLLQGHRLPIMSGPVQGAMIAAFPEIERAVRLNDAKAVVERGTNRFEETLLFADPGFLEMFTFPLRRGEAAQALQDPLSVVLSNEMAHKYFGSDDPLEQTLTLYLGENVLDVQVTGVVAPIPGNSSITFDVLLPLDLIRHLYGETTLTNWGSFAYTTFIQLADGTSIQALTDKLPAFAATHMEAVFGENTSNFSFVLTPFADYHLDPHASQSTGLKAPGNPQHAYILGGIALLILLIASFNFTNLTIGQASTRLKEIGMRKVLGARRGQLIKQFWFEAFLMSVLALALGVLLAEAALPTFNGMADKHLALDYLRSSQSLLILVGLMAMVGLLAGSYPAFVLSGYKPLIIFQGRLRLGADNLFTKSLVATQFFLSIALITCSLIMNQQQTFLRTKNLGFDKEQVVVIPMQISRTTRAQGEVYATALKNELASHPGIVSLTMASSSFTRSTSTSRTEHDGDEVYVYDFRVDYDYLETLGMTLVSGRNFSPDFPTDASEAIIVNETFFKTFGDEIPEDATELDNPTIIGVVQDFNFSSLRSEVLPAHLRLHPGRLGMGYVLARIAPKNIPGTLATMEAAWQKIRPEKPFQYFFLDQEIDQQYKAEERWGAIVTYASVLTILIACLGLFGLTALTAARRTREIGIRKVLGASMPGLVGLLSKDVLKLVLAANVLAWPLAYWAMHQWLQTFAYRIEISSTIFLIAGLSALVIAWLTMSYQSIKAALRNPVDALRYE